MFFFYPFYKSYCQAIGGELATIDDVSEQRFIEGHLTSIKGTLIIQILTTT